MSTIPLLLLALLAACTKTVDTGQEDLDGDGFPAHVDCDDTDPDVYPDATETCDGRDNDCNGELDEDVQVAWYPDEDRDGYGGSGDPRHACTAPAGYVAGSDDCDDADPSLHPGAAEVCDGIDQDCDGAVDEGVRVTWWRDADADGQGDAGDAVEGCGAPSGYTDNAEDCDDGDPKVNTSRAEACNGVDDDCDGFVDEDSAWDATDWYTDTDGDGYGVTTATTRACEAPAGYTGAVGDCDDADPIRNPGMDEVCDGVDNDCDGSADEDAADAPTWYRDADDDGYGDPAASVATCEAAGGWVAEGTDCDDGDATVHPEAVETCDERDEDCDGAADEDAAGAPTWYEDGDGDGFGDPASSTVACEMPVGYSAEATDCEDTDPETHPDAPEICDLLDNDCDGSIDEDARIPTWYADTDGDGWGDPTDTVAACEAPPGRVAEGTDCDDADPAIHPEAEEICDLVDNDCDGVVDDGLPATTWHPDVDGDGWGDAEVATESCLPVSGWTSVGEDCDDRDATVHPEAWEVIGDGTDQDCDGLDGCTDLDCDGTPDLLVPSQQNDADDATLTPILDASLTATFELPGSGVTAARAEDLDGDGYAEVILASLTSGGSYATQALVYAGSEEGPVLTDPTALPITGGWDLEVADLDADGWPDLVFPAWYTGTSYNTESLVYWGSAAGFSTADRTALPTYGAVDVEVADLDADGWLDLVFVDQRSDASWSTTSLIYWGSAAGYSTASRTDVATMGAADVEIADLDADGDLDLAFANYYSGSAYNINSYVYWNEASVFSTASRKNLATYGALAVASADLDEDGWPDLVFANYQTSSTWETNSYVYWGDSVGFSPGNKVSLATSGARDVAIADLDADGWLDVVIAQERDDTRYDVPSIIYWGGSYGLSSSHTTSLEGLGTRRVALGDLDGDGMTDVVLPSCSDGASYASTSFVHWGSGLGTGTSYAKVAVDGACGRPLILGD